MLTTLKNMKFMFKLNKKGNAVAWVIIALIVATAIVVGVYIYTSNQTHPFWEI